MSAIANGIALGIDRKHSEEERNRLLLHEQHARACRTSLSSYAVPSSPMYPTISRIL